MKLTLGKAWFVKNAEKEKGCDVSAVSPEIYSASIYRAALQEIVDRFDELNGSECKRGCGKCIRCIALKALGQPIAVSTKL